MRPFQKQSESDITEIKMSKIENSSGLLAIDLFSGAGGLTEGFRQAGIRSLVANELQHDASLTFKRNHPEIDLVTRDIHDLSGKEIMERAGYVYGSKIKVGDIDIVSGGPPCQGFSTAGLKQEDDPRNQLVWQQIRLVEELKPKVVIIENVEGMLKLYGGVLPDMIKKALNDLGYEVRYRTLYAAHFGVPQMRKRVFFIANRVGSPIIFPEGNYGDINSEYSSQAKYLTNPGLFDDMHGKSIKSGEKLMPFVTVSQAIGDLDFLESGEESSKYRLPTSSNFQDEMRGKNRILFNHKASNHNKRTLEYFSHMIPGGGTETIPEELRTKKTGIQRWHPDRISRAVVTAFEDFVHYRADRIPTVREVARLQTFPDSYEFLGQRTSGNQNRKFIYSSQTQQVSNAVPPKLAKSIAEAVTESLKIARVI